jgi:TRAP-type C4-dicarboxylate transport system substrate-binding protein
MKGKTKVAFVVGVALLFVTLSMVGGFAREVGAADKVFNWKFASHTSPASTSLGPCQRWWCEQVEKRSNGRIKAKMYWVNEVCGPKEMMMAVQSRAADVVGHVPAYTPGETPIMNMTFLPFLAAPRLDQTILVYNRLPKESKAYREEMDQFNCVWAGAYENEGYNLMGKKLVRKASDLKGLRIRCMSDLGKVLKEFGAIPMTTPVTEMYSALDKGIVDMVAHSRLTFNSYKVDEISKYMILDMDMGAAPTLYFINKDAWNELPDDLKKVVDSVVHDLIKFMWDFQHKPERIAKADKVIKDKGIEIIHFPKAERAKLAAKAAGVWEEWAKRSGKYDKAKQALADYIKIRDDVMAKYPNGVVK